MAAPAAVRVAARADAVERRELGKVVAVEVSWLFENHPGAKVPQIVAEVDGLRQFAQGGQRVGRTAESVKAEAKLRFGQSSKTSGDEVNLEWVG